MSGLPARDDDLLAVPRPSARQRLDLTGRHWLRLPRAGREEDEATRLPEARQILRDVLTKEPANAAALDLQKQIGAQ